MKITDKLNPVGLNVSPGQRKYDSVVEQAPKVGPRGVQIDIKAAELSQPFDIDEKLVAAIRQQLQGGEFEIDHDAVAESVLQNAMAFSGRTPITSK